MEQNRWTPLMPSSSSIRNRNLIPAENWVAGEVPIQEVLNCVFPTLDSEDKRKDIIDYMQKIIRASVGVEVFPYGSVPLKTYLPDGDIDLTVLSSPHREEFLPREVFSALQIKSEEQNENTEFELKDVQFIDAEVKLVKCVVQGIVIDVSFNQLGGLCTLAFLERVDRDICRDHLFKRSIMLMKTWCYYESRILGAHYGLISTYALETLVLYIFQVFGASLTSPLMVLYRFLDYYSNFDWDNYCISLDGPVTRSVLPNIVVENPVSQGSGCFLNGESMRTCVDMFMMPLKLWETNVRTFPLRHLNIIDPLKENNNVGRSVHKGNFYRIMCALKYGASKLNEVLESPSENIGDGIKKFFMNTMQNHKSRYIILDATFRSSSTSSFSGEANYEDENGDLDDYILGTDDVGSTNEVADGDMSSSTESYFLDFGKRDSIGDAENLNPFADLTGDYDSHVRSLLHAQCCHGYAFSSSALIDPANSFYGGREPWEVAASPWSAPFQPSSLCPQMNLNNVVTQHAPYLNGRNIAQGVCESVHWDDRNPVSGTEPYFPVMDSPRGRGRQRGHFSPLRHQHWVRRRGAVEINGGLEQRGRESAPQGHEGPNLVEQSSPQGRGQAGSPRRLNTPRKLEFGSFGPLPKPTSDVETSQSCVVYARRPGRITSEPFHLKNEDEFPPLSA